MTPGFPFNRYPAKSKCLLCTVHYAGAKDTKMNKAIVFALGITQSIKENRLINTEITT